MNRRDFLKAMLGAAMAPAVVKAENIMKIWTPPQDIVTPVMHIYDTFGGGDFTAESWVMPAAAGTWSHIALVREAGEIKRYLNGELVRDFPKHMEVTITSPQDKRVLAVQPFDGLMQDLRFTKAARTIVPTTPPADMQLQYAIHMERGLNVFNYK